MAAKVKRLPVEVRTPVDDDDEEEPPRCPPPGAPAWLATFADIATNLMAFFVLILGFAQFDEVSFSKMAGSMREAFGFQIIDPARPNPEGGTVIEMDFRPSGAPPDPVDARQDPADGSAGEGGAGGTGGGGSAAEAAAQALMEALAGGEVTVESAGGSVTLRVPDGADQGAAEALARALADAAGTGPAAGGAGSAGDSTGETSGPGAGEAGAALAESRAAMLDARLQVALEGRMAQGLVSVEQRDGAVFVTVGSGGAFGSGSADLTAEARAIMADLAAAAGTGDARITVTGHTDDVPVTGGAFRDNWDLAAGRAAAVVRALAEEGGIDPGRLTAISRGESDPVGDNATEEGRAQNRRIEIEIDFDGQGN